MELRRYLEQIATASICFPTISPGHRFLAFYSALDKGMGITVFDTHTWEKQLFAPSPVPTSTTVGLIPDLERHRIIYAADCDGDEQYHLYCLDTETGQTSCLTVGSPGRWRPVAISPDGMWLSALSDCSGEIAVWRIGLDGRDRQPLTHGGAILSGGKWSADSQWVVVSVRQRRSVAIVAIAVDGRECRQLSAGVPSCVEHVADWSRIGNELAITSDSPDGSCIGILHLNTMVYTWFDSCSNEQALEISPSGRWLLSIGHRAEEDSLAVYDLETHDRMTVCKVRGQIVLASFVDDERIVAVHSEDRLPAFIVCYNVSNGTREIVAKVTSNLASQQFVACECVEYQSKDGTVIPALLYFPDCGVPPSGFPAIVILHGGPGDFFRVGFDPYAQFLVKLGFVVLEVNIRGSSGFGRAYQEAIRTTWGEMDLADVLAAHTYLETVAHVDAQRIALFGSSYGAFLAARAVADETAKWYAAVLWGGFYDIPALFNEYGHHKWSFLTAESSSLDRNWQELSPIASVSHIECPLLILHGENDTRCSVDQARQFQQALEASGKRAQQDFWYKELPQEGHVPTNRDQLVDVWMVMATFFRQSVGM